MDRVHTDGVDVPTALKDELIDVAMRLVTWAINVLTGRQESTSNTGSAASETANSNRGNETIPLSTAADEEWGWEDEEMGTNLELSGMGGGDEAKEDDDLAMAIAMSLSESRNSGEEAKVSTTTSVSSYSSSSTKMTRPTNNINSSRVSAKDKIKPQRSSPKITSTTPPPSGGDSIEDLLGQMGGNGGAMITSFGQKPKTSSKPKPTPKRESSDDIFASMGLSSIPKTNASSRPPAAPTTGGWQAKSRTQNAPTSAPLPSLRADSLGVDDEDADWGDDGDLDDLLDD